jgi:hypothetical protein
MRIKIKLIEPLETNTDVTWWNINRKRINKVIKLFNEWQTIHKFDDFEAKVVKAHIVSCRKLGSKEWFSSWRFDLLNEMDNFITEYETTY